MRVGTVQLEKGDSRVGVVQKLRPGRTGCGVLIDFAGSDQLVNFDFEIVEFRDGVTELSLVNFETGFVEFAE